MARYIGKYGVEMVWHSNIQTTINIYGSKFDESAALCRVEEWFEPPAGGSYPQPAGAGAAQNPAGIFKGPTGTASVSGVETKAA